MANLSRRSFLKTGAAAFAGFTIAPNIILGKSHGHAAPTDKLNIAAVGVGGRGVNHRRIIILRQHVVAQRYGQYQ